MNAKSFHISVQGANHIKRGRECQDASRSYFDEGRAIAIVCDGHGGDDYFRSAVGSELGCEVAEDNIKKFLDGMDKAHFFENPERHLMNLKASIINDWNEAVAGYHAGHPIEEAELQGVSERSRQRYLEGERIERAYGTTMIAVAMCEEYWFGIHIGDGKCVEVDQKGEFSQPIPWDPKCFLNVTTSICDADAIAHFRDCYADELPAAVFIGSDGIDDCFSNDEQLHNLYKTVLYSFATSDLKEATQGLAEYLPRLSARGSGDDMSIAAVFHFDLIPELSIVRDYDKAKERARVEENARKEAERNEAEKKRVEEEHARFQQQNNAGIQRPGRLIQPKYCQECGAQLNPGAKFCSNCGVQLQGKVFIPMDTYGKPLVDGAIQFGQEGGQQGSGMNEEILEAGAVQPVGGETLAEATGASAKEESSAEATGASAREETLAEATGASAKEESSAEATGASAKEESSAEATGASVKEETLAEAARASAKEGSLAEAVGYAAKPSE